MAKSKLNDHPVLFAVGAEENPSLLSVADDRTTERGKPVKKSGDRTTEPSTNVVSFPQTQETPVAVDESRWPSRKQRRKGLRLDPQEVLKTESWLVGRRGICFNDVVNGLLRAFNAGTIPTIPGLGVRSSVADYLIDQTMTKEDELDQESVSNSDSSIPSGRPDDQENPQGAEVVRIEEIIAFYEVTTGTAHSPKDIQALRSVFDFPDDVIYTGILRSVLYVAGEDGGPGRVGSFKYCVKTIRQISKSRVDPRQEFWRMYETFNEKVRGGQILLPREGAAFLQGRFGKKEEQG